MPRAIDLNAFFDGPFVRALPLFKDLKSQMRSVSSAKGTLKDWLNSEEGQEWLRLRKNMYAPKEDEAM